MNQWVDGSLHVELNKKMARYMERCRRIDFSNNPNEDVSFANFQAIRDLIKRLRHANQLVINNDENK